MATKGGDDFVDPVRLIGQELLGESVGSRRNQLPVRGDPRDPIHRRQLGRDC
ncbi:MAG: hypothetical protein ACRD1K_04060 [Acidimicrobiales bacterium]